MGGGFMEESIVKFLLSIGEPIEEESRGYYRHKIHTSLVVVEKKNYFFWNAEQKGGGIYNYLIEVLGFTKEEAKKKIAETYKNSSITTKRKPQETIDYLKEFVYPVKISKNPYFSRRYLIQERQITRHIVENLLREQYICQDIYRNTVFNWWKDNEIVGVSKQLNKPILSKSDRKVWKYTYPTTEENTFWGFNYKIGKPKNIYFFEGAVDLLSFFSLYESTLEDVWLVETEGVKIQSLLTFVRHAKNSLNQLGLDIESLHICYDNDKAGNAAMKEIEENIKYYVTQNGEPIYYQNRLPRVPKGQESIHGWDYNNLLRYHLGD